MRVLRWLQMEIDLDRLKDEGGRTLGTEDSHGNSQVSRWTSMGQRWSAEHPQGLCGSFQMTLLFSIRPDLFARKLGEFGYLKSICSYLFAMGLHDIASKHTFCCISLSPYLFKKEPFWGTPAQDRLINYICATWIFWYAIEYHPKLMIVQRHLLSQDEKLTKSSRQVLLSWIGRGAWFGWRRRKLRTCCWNLKLTNNHHELY